MSELRNARIFSVETLFRKPPCHSISNSMPCMHCAVLILEPSRMITPAHLNIIVPFSVVRSLTLKNPSTTKLKNWLLTHSLHESLIVVGKFSMQIDINVLISVQRIILNKDSLDQLKDWLPTAEEFDDVVEEIHSRFATSAAADNAIQGGDEVLAHSILFIRDALFFWEFCDAVRDADVGRMWLVYDFWLYMMRGAGCHNYGNELLEMKAQFLYE